MTTQPFPLDALSGWDAATLLASHQLDQWNPGASSGGIVWFPDCAVVGAACTLGYVHCDCPFTGVTATTPFFGDGDSLGASGPFFWTTSLEVHSATALTTYASTSFRNLAGFELINRREREASYSNSTQQWLLPDGMSFTTTTIYTTTTLPGTNATAWNVDVAIRSDGRAICQYSQTSSVLYENHYKLEPWGRWTARTLVREREKERRNREAMQTRRKRGPGPRHDSKREAVIADAYKTSGARSCAEGARLLKTRFPELTEVELRKLKDRHRHRK